MTKEDIFKIVEDEGVEFIRLQFTDMFGTLKNIAITVSQLEKALDNKFMFDGSSVEGFVRIEESDMYLYPDLDTFEIFPWRPQQGKVARLICDIYKVNRTVFEGNPRNILTKVLDKAKEKGYIFNIAPECEFFLFPTDDSGEPDTHSTEKASYFDIGPLDTSENVRRDIVLSLEEMGYYVKASHHERAMSQHEVDFDFSDALCAADEIMTAKMAIKAIARRHGLYATFMPKPIKNINGSGLHINMRLFDDKGNNLFYDADDKNELSSIAYNFMAGILKHMREMSLITNPLINSYKRLVPGYDAPVYTAWSSNSNRSSLIRLSSERGKDIGIVLRCLDSATNPYFAFALCLAAGLEGINKNLTPPESINRNIFDMQEDELKQRQAKLLPRNMGEAIALYEKSDFVKEILGEHAFYQYLYAKKKEWKRFEEIVTDWEVEEYLYKY